MYNLLKIASLYLNHKKMRSLGIAMILIFSTNFNSLKAKPKAKPGFGHIGLISGGSSDDGDSMLGIALHAGTLNSNALHAGTLNSNSPIMMRSQIEFNFGLGFDKDYIDIDGVQYRANRTVTQTELRYHPLGVSLNGNVQLYAAVGFGMVYTNYWDFSFERVDTNNIEDDSSRETLAGEVAQNQAGQSTRFQIGPAATVGFGLVINDFGLAFELIAEPILVGSDLSRNRYLFAITVVSATTHYEETKPLQKR